MVRGLRRLAEGQDAAGFVRALRSHRLGEDGEVFLSLFQRDGRETSLQQLFTVSGPGMVSSALFTPEKNRPHGLHPPHFAGIQRFNGFPARPPNFREFYAQTYLSNRVGRTPGCLAPKSKPAA